MDFNFQYNIKRSNRKIAILMSENLFILDFNYLHKGERKPIHLTSVFSFRTSVLSSAKAVSVVPSGGDETDVHRC